MGGLEHLMGRAVNGLQRAGEMVLARQKYSPATVAWAIETIRLTGTLIHFEIPQSLPAVIVNPSAIHQVFVNLITNTVGTAVHFTLPMMP
jgi:signal transduction histidine kinase